METECPPLFADAVKFVFISVFPANCATAAITIAIRENEKMNAYGAGLAGFNSRFSLLRIFNFVCWISSSLGFTEEQREPDKDQIT